MDKMHETLSEKITKSKKWLQILVLILVLVQILVLPNKQTTATTKTQHEEWRQPGVKCVEDGWKMVA
jgi:hypothetical protein